MSKNSSFYGWCKKRNYLITVRKYLKTEDGVWTIPTKFDVLVVVIGPIIIITIKIFGANIKKNTCKNFIRRQDFPKTDRKK